MAGDEPGTESPKMGSFLLSLRLGGTEPPVGTITPADGTGAHPFHGWIDLMGAINRFRGWHETEPDRRPHAPTTPHPKDTT
jgi:hypothetical protein